MAKVTRIVLTGGPCGGKTTGLAKVEQTLTQLGYKVIIMEEMATQVMKSGINALNCKDFQYLLVMLQKQRDEIYEKILSNFDGKVVILYDRGILDGQAYEGEEGMLKVLEHAGLKKNEVRGYYDAVFHLTSSAIGAREHYTKANNTVRIENVDEAVDADYRTLKCWIGHKHLRVIDNENKDFTQKINCLVKEILAFLGEPEPLEIERKFLIEKPPIEILKEKAIRVPIFQTYLRNDGSNSERRIRMIGENGDYNYYYTEKLPVCNGVRKEIERKITQYEYLDLLTESDLSLYPVKKTRYCFVYKNKYYELDIYPFWKNAILEVELSDINEEVEVPDFINLIKDVTGDSRYNNINLAKNSLNVPSKTKIKEE